MELMVKTADTVAVKKGWLSNALNNKKVFYGTVGLFLVSFICTYLNQIFQQNSYSLEKVLSAFTIEEFLIYCLVGFLAQAIDGALGMAYGVSSTSFLMSAGVSPAVASASVHIAEVFTSGVSGLSHLKFGNVNNKLFRSLVLPGVLGAFLGAYLLTSIDGNSIKPFVSAYLLIMGVIIIRKSFKKFKKKKKTKNISTLALTGGFVDSVGGGGWGPVVSSTLISKGRSPRYTIGSVNLAEFFVALASALTFIFMLGTNNWIVIAGLIVGGIFAAPFAAYLVKRFKVKTMMIIVGSLIIALSLRTIVLAII